MAQTIIMPKLGQTVEESTIVKWHKQVGETVTKGDILFEIETDKALLEVESFFEGTLLKIIVPEGQPVPVTTPVAFIGTPGEPIPDLPTTPAPAKSGTPAGSQPVAPVPMAAAAPSAAPATQQLTPAPATPPPAAPQHAISPRARRLLRDLPIDASLIAASGARVTERDVHAYLETSGYNRLRLTPAAKALALKENINVLEAAPGTDGTIGVDEIHVAIAEKPQPLSTIRQVIARRMLQSTSGIPHFYVTVSADVTELLLWRKELKKNNQNYSLNDFIIKAVALALRDFPPLNSSTDGKTIRWHSRVHVGMAVAVPDGLVVPVVREADRISMSELHERCAQLAVRARDGKLTPDEMSGGTFTVSNMGMLNVEDFTAIINPGEAAILAVAAVRPQPVVIKNELVIRSLMKLTLSSDHRIVDGALAARFINKVRGLIEDLAIWKNMIS